MNAQLALHVVHDVVHAVQLSRADLLALEVYLETPEDEGLLILFGLFEENVDDVVDRWRDGQKQLLRTDLVALVQFFLNDWQAFNIVYLISLNVKHTQQYIPEKPDEPPPLIDLQLRDEDRLFLFLQAVPVKIDHRIQKC